MKARYTQGADHKGSRLHDQLNRRGILINLGTNGSGTADAEVLVLVPFRENQEQPLSYWNRGLASGTVKRSGLKLLKARFSHCFKL